MIRRPRKYGMNSCDGLDIEVCGMHQDRLIILCIELYGSRRVYVCKFIENCIKIIFHHMISC